MEATGALILKNKAFRYKNQHPNDISLINIYVLAVTIDCQELLYYYVFLWLTDWLIAAAYI